MTTVSKDALRVETPEQEHDRLQAQRERIARIYGHRPIHTPVPRRPLARIVEAPRA